MVERTRKIKAGEVEIGGEAPLVLMAGVCVIENYEHTLFIAERLKKTCSDVGIPLVFKASYDKANRTSIDSYRGPGLEKGLEILSRIKDRTGLPLLVDFHQPSDAGKAAEVADILQVPAFLCRQTDLLLAAAATGKPVNVKKGQFLAPEDMAHVAAKLERGGCRAITLTERGASFGYHRLVGDMTSLAVMRSLGWPVVFDATHSVQFPGGDGEVTGGTREMVPILARAAVAAGCDAVFMEVHDRPERALSDASSVLPLDRLPELLKTLAVIDRVVRK